MSQARAQELNQAQGEIQSLNGKIASLETTIEDDKQKLAVRPITPSLIVLSATRCGVHGHPIDKHTDIQQLLQDEQAAATKYTTQHQALLEAEQKVQDLEARLAEAEGKASSASEAAVAAATQAQVDQDTIAALKTEVEELEGSKGLQGEREALEGKIRAAEEAREGAEGVQVELKQVSSPTVALRLEVGS